MGGAARRRLLGSLAATIIAVSQAASLAAPAHAAAPRFFAGAGVADITPPLSGTAAAAAADAQFQPDAAALCPSAAFPDHGRFALQEPFKDFNGDGQWDAGADLKQGPTGKLADPFCDVNANGRWDGIYADNGNGPATGVHDPIDVRAIAISDGEHLPVVYASVTAIGLFDYYTDLARSDLRDSYHVVADLVVSANHNESSPDTIGLYGALQTPLGVGLRSGIDEAYMRFLADRVAHAAADAVDALEPARLYANQIQGPLADGAQGSSYPLLSGMSQRISDQFPTTVALPGDDRIAAVDPKLGVLQARRADGTPIFTVMSEAAHNQEMGNSGAGLSGDWPRAFENTFDTTHPGVAIFLVGDNGSIEDPQTSPTVIPNGSENHSNQATQIIQAQATGARFAQLAAGAAARAVEIDPGPVRLVRRQVCVALENNGFLALAAAGVFGLRQGYLCDQSGNPIAAIPNGSVVPTVSNEFRTYIGYADVGPDLQLIDIPGEAFPALMLGSPFGVEDASCSRPNPAVPTWHAHGLFRFQVGLADDLLGYLIPAWGFASGTPGLFNTDACYQDAHGHRHKLESESIGPLGANTVANGLAGLLDGEPDPRAHIASGRFVLADGSYSRWPTGAVAVAIPASGTTTLDPTTATVIGAPDAAGFGARAVDGNGVFMDYDGQPQARPDVTTRGIMTFDSNGCVAARHYVDVFPTLDTSRALGAVVHQPVSLPSAACPVLNAGGTPELQPGAALRAGLPVGPPRGAGRPSSATLKRLACVARSAPRSFIARSSLLVRRGVLALSGRATARRCGARRGARIARVVVQIARRANGRCRFVAAGGRLGPTRDCRRPVGLLARSVGPAGGWSLRLRLHVPSGRYRVRTVAIDTSGRSERPGGSDVGVMHVP